MTMGSHPDMVRRNWPILKSNRLIVCYNMNILHILAGQSKIKVPAAQFETSV